MPKITTTGFERRLEHEAPHLSKSQRKAAAKRIAWRMQKATQWVDATPDEVYEAGLRILGIHSDPTAREALQKEAA